jgi:hypothetical protein
MFKLGVFRPEDYCSEPPGWFGRSRWRLIRHRISLRLLRTAIPASPREIAVFETLMKGLRLSSGVYRTTFHGRFRDLDRLVNELLLERFPSSAALEIQDWAASDGLTSSEWAASLFPLFPAARLTASDLILFLVEISYGKHVIVQERDGQALQYIAPSFVIDVSRPDPRPSVLSRLMLARAKSAMAQVKARLTIPDIWLDSDSDSLSLPPFEIRKLPMIHPEAASFRVQDGRFSIVEHSAFDVLSRPADVIRSMNIYNPSYFEPVRLAAGAKAVWSSLRPGGLWIVGRTWRDNPPAHMVTIFEKTDAGFGLVRRCGDGAEIESLVLGQVPP